MYFLNVFVIYILSLTLFLVSFQQIGTALHRFYKMYILHFLLFYVLKYCLKIWDHYIIVKFGLMINRISTDLCSMSNFTQDFDYAIHTIHQ